jgi:hypothetical protein
MADGSPHLWAYCSDHYGTSRCRERAPSAPSVLNNSSGDPSILNQTSIASGKALSPIQGNVIPL